MGNAAAEARVGPPVPPSLPSTVPETTSLAAAWTTALAAAAAVAMADELGMTSSVIVGEDLVRQGYNLIHAVGRAAARGRRDGGGGQCADAATGAGFGSFRSGIAAAARGNGERA